MQIKVLVTVQQSSTTKFLNCKSIKW